MTSLITLWCLYGQILNLGMRCGMAGEADTCDASIPARAPIRVLTALSAAQRKMALVLGLLPPVWETRMEFLAAGFGLALLWLLVTI